MLSFEKKCDNFTKILRDSAEKLNCIFEEESGEGHDMETETLFCEDVAGWLIPADRKDEFMNSDRADNKWDNFFVFAEWQKDNDNIKINFTKYTA